MTGPRSSSRLLLLLVASAASLVLFFACFLPRHVAAYERFFDSADVDTQKQVVYDPMPGPSPCILSNRKFGNVRIFLLSIDPSCTQLIIEDCQMRTLSLGSDNKHLVQGSLQIIVRRCTLTFVHLYATGVDFTGSFTVDDNRFVGRIPFPIWTSLIYIALPNAIVRGGFSIIISRNQFLSKHIDTFYAVHFMMPQGQAGGPKPGISQPLQRFAFTHNVVRGANKTTALTIGSDYAPISLPILDIDISFNDIRSHFAAEQDASLPISAPWQSMTQFFYLIKVQWTRSSRNITISQNTIMRAQVVEKGVLIAGEGQSYMISVYGAALAEKGLLAITGNVATWSVAQWSTRDGEVCTMILVHAYGNVSSPASAAYGIVVSDNRVKFVSSVRTVMPAIGIFLDQASVDSATTPPIQGVQHINITRNTIHVDVTTRDPVLVCPTGAMPVVVADGIAVSTDLIAAAAAPPLSVLISSNTMTLITDFDPKTADAMIRCFTNEASSFVVAADHPDTASTPPPFRISIADNICTARGAASKLGGFALLSVVDRRPSSPSSPGSVISLKNNVVDSMQLSLLRADIYSNPAAECVLFRSLRFLQISFFIDPGALLFDVPGGHAIVSIINNVAHINSPQSGGTVAFASRWPIDDQAGKYFGGSLLVSGNTFSVVRRSAADPPATIVTFVIILDVPAPQQQHQGSALARIEISSNTVIASADTFLLCSLTDVVVLPLLIAPNNNIAVRVARGEQPATFTFAPVREKLGLQNMLAFQRTTAAPTNRTPLGISLVAVQSRRGSQPQITSVLNDNFINISVIADVVTVATTSTVKTSSSSPSRRTVASLVWTQEAASLSITANRNKIVVNEKLPRTVSTFLRMPAAVGKEGTPAVVLAASNNVFSGSERACFVALTGTAETVAVNEDQLHNFTIHGSRMSTSTYIGGFSLVCDSSGAGSKISFPASLDLSAPCNKIEDRVVDFALVKRQLTTFQGGIPRVAGCYHTATRSLNATATHEITQSLALPAPYVAPEFAVLSSKLQGTNAVASVVVAAVVPTLGFAVARQQAMVGLVQRAKTGNCAGIDEEAGVDAASSPTQVQIGTSVGRLFVGAAVMNTVLVMCLVLLAQAVGTLYLKVTHSSSWQKPMHVFARCHVAMVLYVTTSILMSPSLTMALVVLTVKDVATGHKVLAAVFALLLAAATVYHAVWALLVRERTEKYKKMIASEKEIKERNLFRRFLVYWFEGPGEWVMPSGGNNQCSEKQHLQFDAALPQFEGYSDRAFWFSLPEVAVQVALAVAALITQFVPQNKSCVTDAVMQTVILGGYCFLCVWKRPFQELFLRIMVPVMTVVQMVVLVVVAATVHSGLPTWIDSLVVAVSSLQSFMVLFTLLAALQPMAAAALKAWRRFKSRILSRPENARPKAWTLKDLLRDRQHTNNNSGGRIVDSDDDDDDPVELAPHHYHQQERDRRSHNNRPSSNNESRREASRSDRRPAPIATAVAAATSDNRRNGGERRREIDDRNFHSQRPSAVPQRQSHHSAVAASSRHSSPTSRNEHQRAAPAAAAVSRSSHSRANNGSVARRFADI